MQTAEEKTQNLCLYCSRQFCRPWNHKCSICKQKGHENHTCFNKEKAKLSRGQRRRRNKNFKKKNISFRICRQCGELVCHSQLYV